MNTLVRHSRTHRGPPTSLFWNYLALKHRPTTTLFPSRRRYRCAVNPHKASRLYLCRLTGRSISLLIFPPLQASLPVQVLLHRSVNLPTIGSHLLCNSFFKHCFLVCVLSTSLVSSSTQFHLPKTNYYFLSVLCLSGSPLQLSPVLI